MAEQHVGAHDEHSGVPEVPLGCDELRGGRSVGLLGESDNVVRAIAKRIARLDIAKSFGRTGGADADRHDLSFSRACSCDCHRRMESVGLANDVIRREGSHDEGAVALFKQSGRERDCRH